MMTPDDFRRIALGMSGAIEASHMNHPDFRAFGKIFATISPDATKGMVSLTPEEQARFLREHPAMFAPAAGAWGRQGATMVILAAAGEEVVGEAMTLAWQGVERKAAAAAGRPRRRSPSKPARGAGKRKATKVAKGTKAPASAKRATTKARRRPAPATPARRRPSARRGRKR
jgi:hypothetical protein